jgi:group I intron endonuclease
VYLLKNKISGKVYIGATTRKLSRRYIGRSWSQCAKNESLRKDLEEIGQDNFDLSILEECYSKEEMDRKETEFILSYNSRDPEIGYNTYTGGIKGSVAGRAHIEKLLRNLGKNRRIGWRHMWDNPIHRENLCKAISKAKKGKAPILSPEAKERQRLAVIETGRKNRGVKRGPQSESSKKKKSESMKLYWKLKRSNLSQGD